MTSVDKSFYKRESEQQTLYGEKIEKAYFSVEIKGNNTDINAALANELLPGEVRTPTALAPRPTVPNHNWFGRVCGGRRGGWRQHPTSNDSHPRSRTCGCATPRMAPFRASPWFPRAPTAPTTPTPRLQFLLLQAQLRCACLACDRSC